MWEPEDSDDFAAMCAEPEVVRFTTIDGKPLSAFNAWDRFVITSGIGTSGLRTVCCRGAFLGQEVSSVGDRFIVTAGRILKFSASCARSFRTGYATGL